MLTYTSQGSAADVQNNGTTVHLPHTHGQASKKGHGGDNKTTKSSQKPYTGHIRRGIHLSIHGRTLQESVCPAWTVTVLPHGLFVPAFVWTSRHWCRCKPNKFCHSTQNHRVKWFTRNGNFEGSEEKTGGKGRK